MKNDQENSKQDFHSWCQGMPFADMMRNIMSRQRGGSNCGCAEMMLRMMKCCGAQKEEEETSKGA